MCRHFLSLTSEHSNFLLSWQNFYDFSCLYVFLWEQTIELFFAYLFFFFERKKFFSHMYSSLLIRAKPLYVFCDRVVLYFFVWWVIVFVWIVKTNLAFSNLHHRYDVLQSETFYFPSTCEYSIPSRGCFLHQVTLSFLSPQTRHTVKRIRNSKCF